MGVVENFVAEAEENCAGSVGAFATRQDGLTLLHLAAKNRRADCLAPLLNHIDVRQRTLGQIRRKPRINSHLIIYCPTSEGVSEQMNERVSERSGVRERSE